MARTSPLRDVEYRILIRRLIAARNRAGLTQAEVARRLTRPPSFVVKVERLYRRLDVLELWYFLQIYGMSGDEFYAAPTAEERLEAARRGP